MNLRGRGIKEFHSRENRLRRPLMYGHRLGGKLMNPGGGCAKDYFENLAGVTVNKPEQQCEKPVDGIFPVFQLIVCFGCKPVFQLMILVEVPAVENSEIINKFCCGGFGD